MATKKLQAYQAKRDFSQTKEPSGDAAAGPGEAGAKLRFVVQKHDATRLHYDLRLELDGVFKSWAVTKGPSVDPKDRRLAVEVEDHPLDYGDFEGTIPKGQYGGGTVQLWDRGYWSPEGMTAEEGLAKGDLKFTLAGEHLHGSWVLVRIKNWSGGKRVNWLLIKHRDEFAQEGGAEQLLAEDQSVASGRGMEEIAAGQGRPPKPFMQAGAAVAKDAVWDSNEGLAPALRGSGETHVKARKPPATKRTTADPASADARVHRAAALPDCRAAAGGGGLGARDQARRLSRAGADGRWQDGVAHAQGAGLDREVLRHRDRLPGAAGLHRRRGDRGARRQRRAGFRRVAGGAVGGG